MMCDIDLKILKNQLEETHNEIKSLQILINNSELTLKGEICSYFDKVKIFIIYSLVLFYNLLFLFIYFCR